ncbi:MAG: FAD:protein FMN transferase [Bacteroidia bacterium]
MHKKLMGTAFEFVLHHLNQNDAEQILELGVQEVERIESLLTEFKSNSITSQLNANAGKEWVVVGEEVFNLLKRCHGISHLSKGSFDITVGPLKSIYKFKNTNFQMPSEEEINRALGLVGYTSIELDESSYSARLQKKNMRISFAAIGKGYAADRVKKLWLTHGIQSAVISASGDMCTIGKSGNGKKWNVGIADPQNKERTLCRIPLFNSSVATSGNYEQFFEYQGVRYSHNINPLTGYPVKGIKSVSVVSPAAELSDALATAITIKGVESGLDFVNQLPETHCLIVDDLNQVHTSKSIQIEYEN